MTEHHHDTHGGHGGHGGGHELDAPPTRELFNIVWGLGALTLLSLVTCVQLFNGQARDIASERGKEGSALLAKYRKDMETRTRGAGEDSVADATGKVVGRYSYIPLASARDLILAKPEKLGAFAPPAGWIHPDDVASGGQKAAAPTPTPAAPVDPNAPAGAEGTPPAGAEGTPTGAAVEGTPPAGAPAEGTPPAGAPAGAPAAAPAEGTPPAALPPGTKDDAMPLNADKGQSESSKPAPGGTVEPVGAKSTPAPVPAPAPAH